MQAILSSARSRGRSRSRGRTVAICWKGDVGSRLIPRRVRAVILPALESSRKRNAIGERLERAECLRRPRGCGDGGREGLRRHCRLPVGRRKRGEQNAAESVAGARGIDDSRCDGRRACRGLAADERAVSRRASRPRAARRARREACRVPNSPRQPHFDATTSLLSDPLVGRANRESGRWLLRFRHRSVGLSVLSESDRERACMPESHLVTTSD